MDIKIARMANAIMTNSVIVITIYEETEVRVNFRIHFLEYIVYTCPASFQIQNGGCVLRVYEGLTGFDLSLNTFLPRARTRAIFIHR